MKNNLRTGRLGFNRRSFLKGASGAVAAMAALPGLGRAEESSGPRKGGRLKIGLDSAATADTLDPAVSQGAYIETVNFTWGNCLVELDEKLNAVPELATSWEPSKDAKTWVFKLRKGVTFHNGKEFNAEDVVHTMNYHRGPDSKSGAKSILANIEDIKASDTHEITVTLNSPEADMAYVFSATQLLIMPANEKTSSGIGTGAYKITSFDPGVKTVGERNPDYWKEGRAHVDSVEIIAINNQQARHSAIQTKAVDLIRAVNPNIVNLMKRAGVNVITVPGTGFYNFPMRLDAQPFSNADVRQAMKHAINRQELLDRILGGFGTLGNDHPVPKFDPYFAHDLPQTEYDPDKAKFHIQKAGDVAIELAISDAAFPGATDAAVLFKEQAEKAGINIALRRVPEDGYWTNTWLKEPFCGSYWSGKPTADLILSQIFLSSSAWNETAWKNESFDQILVAARGELDVTKRKQMYFDLQKMLHDDGGAIIPVFNNQLFASGQNIAGMVLCPVATGKRVSEQLYFTA